MTERSYLTPYQQWMVQSNVERVRAGEADGQATVALLRANGYPCIAAAVEEALRNE